MLRAVVRPPETVAGEAKSSYVLGAALPASGTEEIYLADRIAPPALRGPVVVKYARSTKPSYAVLRERLLDEALENASFVHPCLTAVADVIENEAGLFLVLEHTRGASLHAVNKALREKGRALSFELAAYVALELLKGIHHLHTARGPSGERLTIMIRDLTPGHVWLSATGRVKIANRGLAAVVVPMERQTPGELVAHYAPERIAGEPFSVRSDLYAVGLMLFELLTGRRCFASDHKDQALVEIVTRGVPLPELQMIQAPAALIRAVELSTAVLPERRYTSAVDMARELEQWLFANAPKDLPRVAARFFGLLDVPIVTTGANERDPAAFRFEGSPLYAAGAGDDTRALTVTGVEPTAEELELIASRPELAALFPGGAPTGKELAFVASVLRDGLTEVEARAIATRPALPSAPGPSGAQPPPPHPAGADGSGLGPRQPGPGADPAAQGDLRVGSRAWWKETIVLVIIALAMLLLAVASSLLDRGEMPLGFDLE